jgi:2,2-dialkylglycine decarboxylase (pyruvate)
MNSLLTKVHHGLIRYGGFRAPLHVIETQGVYLHLANGRRTLDFTSGHFCSVLGHGHPEIVKTITKYASGLDHVINGAISSPVAELASKLRSLLPEKLNKSMFLSTGTEANEAAIKLAKTYTGKFEIVALADSWHGMTGSALANTYIAGRKSHGPLVSTCLRLLQVWN